MQNEIVGYEMSDAAAVSVRRWMVVDDTPAVLEAVAMLLESLGCAEVSRINSAEEALEAFAADPEGYELIVTDYNMPGMTGTELCEAVRDISPWQKLLLATGSADITEREAMAHGFRGLLRKPFPMREMIAALEHAGIPTGREQTATAFMQKAAESVAMFSAAWAAA